MVGGRLLLLSVMFSAVFATVLASSAAFALTYSASTDKSSYSVNDTLNVSITSDISLNNTNVSIYITATNGTVYNYVTNLTMNTTLNRSLTVNVSTGGDYYLKSNYSYNGTYYESSLLVKASRASDFVIGSDKSVYGPSEGVNFTVKATDRNKGGVGNESVNVKMIYQNNDTRITNLTGLTNAAGEFSGQLTAPAVAGTYRLVVNDWLATKVFDVSAFDTVAFIGDSTGSSKSIFGVNETAYIFVDMFSTNKTKYLGTEGIAINVTFPNGTSVSNTYTFSGSRLNTTIFVSLNGTYTVKVRPASITKVLELSFKGYLFELRGTLESPSRGATNSFFPNEEARILVRAYNLTSGDVILSNFTNGTWEVKILDGNLATIDTPSNSSVWISPNTYRFNFSTPNTSALYYVRVKLNGTEYITDFMIKGTAADAMPVDQEYNFKNVFIGNKQTVRVVTTLSNVTGTVNVTNITVLEVRKSGGTSNIRDSLNITTNITTVRGNKAGLVQFSAPRDAGWYFIKTLANSNFAGETWFLVRTYSVCSQLSGYKWFVSSNESVSFAIEVTEARDIGFVESSAGNTTGSSNTTYGNMYGMYDCYGAAGTTVSGASKEGNTTANVKVSISKIYNTHTMEDVTSKVSSLPSNNTDSNGRTILKLDAPSRGWDSGYYNIEYALSDQNNNTDKGWGWFNVKNLWINVWPKQYSGYWKWYFSPNENFTLEVRSYNSSGNWNWYGQEEGTGDNCYVLDIFYQGSSGEWFWPPKTVSQGKYNWTCANATANGTRGRFNLNITPNSTLSTGYYMVRVKVNTSSGVSDTGDGWFNLKAYNMFSRSLSSTYYDSWYRNATENVSFILDVTNASSTLYSCWWQACPQSERSPGQLNISLKKIIKYDQWQPKDYSTTKYNGTLTNNTSVAGPSATVSINTTNGEANITLIPKGGTGSNAWETGYYNAIFEVNGPEGSETVSGWYEIRSFFVDMQTVYPNGSARYAYRSNENITINLTAASKPRWMSTYYGITLNYYNATVTSWKLSYWAPNTYKMVTVPVNITPGVVNGTSTLNVTPLETLAAGNWYNLEVTLRDDNGNEQTGYVGFQIKDFTFSAQARNWKWEYTGGENITIDAMVCDADKWWCYSPNSYNGEDVTVRITNVYKTNTWPYTKVTSNWASATRTATSSTNGNATLNLTQTNNGLTAGYHMAEVTASYSSGSGTAQTSNVWFYIKPYALTVNMTKWEYNMRENATLMVVTGSTISMSDASLTCGYWPDYRTYMLGTNLGANKTTDITSGVNYIMLFPTAGSRWSSGWCWGSVTFTDSVNPQTFSIYFNMKGFTLYANPVKYYHSLNESVIMNISTDTGQYVNITNISLTSWDNWPDVTELTINRDFTANATNFTTVGAINLTPVGNNKWPSYGWFGGQLTGRDLNTTSLTLEQKTWIGFYIAPPIWGWGWLSDAYGNYKSMNTSAGSKNATFWITANRYNPATRTFSGGANIDVSLVQLVKENCYVWPCTYSIITGYNVTNATTTANGTAMVNVSKNSVWDYGSYRATFLLNDTTNLETVNNTRIWFWVSQV